jgi:hypothetical protein
MTNLHVMREKTLIAQHKQRVEKMAELRENTTLASE